MKKSTTLPLLLLIFLLLPACKPTENNYKAAYDTALSKRQKEATDPDILIPGGKLSADDAPVVETVDSIRILVRREHLKLIDGPGPLPKYSVVIASYKMTANARAHWEELSKSAPGARLLQNPAQVYLIAVEATPHLHDAAHFIQDYRNAHKGEHYVGIPEEEPVLYEAAGMR